MAYNSTLKWLWQARSSTISSFTNSKHAFFFECDYLLVVNLFSLSPFLYTKCLNKPSRNSPISKSRIKEIDQSWFHILFFFVFIVVPFPFKLNPTNNICNNQFAIVFVFLFAYFYGFCVSGFSSWSYIVCHLIVFQVLWSERFTYLIFVYLLLFVQGRRN